MGVHLLSYRSSFSTYVFLEITELIADYIHNDLHTCNDVNGCSLAVEFHMLILGTRVVLIDYRISVFLDAHVMLLDWDQVPMALKLFGYNWRECRHYLVD